MKIAIITDQHFGVRGDSSAFLTNAEEFYTTIFFPYLKKHGIKEVWDLGDTFDKRKFINIETIHRVKKFYFDVLQKEGIKLHILLGNHTTYYKNTSEVNTIESVLKEYNVTVYSDPQEVVIGNLNVSIIPWINESNEGNLKYLLRNTKSKIAFGHLEIQGFQVLRGIKCETGFDKTLFDVYDKVFTGHFHQKHDNGKIFYLGSPYQTTAADLNEPKGFHIFDTETLDLEFVRNPYDLYLEFVYDDSKNNYDNFDFSVFRNKYVKIKVIKKSQIKLETFIMNVEKQEPYNVNIVDIQEMNSTPIPVNEFENTDTLSLINSHIDLLETENKETLKNIIHDLYIESMDTNIEEDDEK